MSNPEITQDSLDKLASWEQKTTTEIELTLKSLIVRQFSISPQPPRYLTPEEFDQSFPDGPIVVNVTFSEVELGQWSFLLPQSFGGILARLITTGETETDFDPETHAVPLGEIWGQLAASLEDEITTLLGREITVQPATVTMDTSSVLVKLDTTPAIQWDISLEEWGDGQVFKLVDPDFVALFGKTEDASSQLLEPDDLPDMTAAAGKEPRKKFDDTMNMDLNSPDQEPYFPPRPVATPAVFADFGSELKDTSAKEPRNIDLLLDINLPITIELGRTNMLIKDVLGLGPGSVIELDKLSGEPVDLYVNDKKFARGEVVVIEENFGVRITELIHIDERLKALK